MAERNGAEFGVFFIDLDRFKNINDSMGHTFGDRVLIEVAERIKRCLRDVDTLCRLGGDEFVIFLQGIDAHGAEVLARRILDTMGRPFQIDELSFIGNWVLEEAVRQAVVWQNRDTPVTVSINVSALQFQQSDFVEVVATVLKSAGLAPHLLELELTESILVKAPMASQTAPLMASQTAPPRPP